MQDNFGRTMFKYGEYYIDRKVSVFIKKLWILDNLLSLLPVAGKSVLPNGCFNIAVIEGAGLIVKHLGWEKYLTQGTYFCGQMTESISVDILPQTKATMVQLYPWAPVYFNSIDMSTYTDQICTMEVSGIDSGLWQRLPGINNEDICRLILESFLPMLQQQALSKFVLEAAETIMHRNGKITMHQLGEELNCSTRHLQKVFKKHIGLSPKQLAGILRLRDAIDGIAYPHARKISLTDLALHNQFYDQAHFINAFKSVVKTSPGNFNPPDYFLSFKK